MAVKEQTGIDLDDCLPKEVGRRGRREGGWGRYAYTCLVRMPEQRVETEKAAAAD